MSRVRVWAPALLLSGLLVPFFVIVAPGTAGAQTLLVPTVDACGNNSSAVAANGGYPLLDSTVQQVQAHANWVAAQNTGSTNKTVCTTYLGFECIMSMGTTATDNSKLNYLLRCLFPPQAAPIVDSDGWSFLDGAIWYRSNNNTVSKSFDADDPGVFVPSGLNKAFGVFEPGWSNAGAAVDAAQYLCSVQLRYYPEANPNYFYTLQLRTDNPGCTSSGVEIGKQKGTCCFLPDWTPETTPDWQTFDGCENLTVKSADNSNTNYVVGDVVPAFLAARKPPGPDPQTVTVTLYTEAQFGEQAQSVTVQWPGAPNFTWKVPRKEGVGDTAPRKLDYVQFLVRCADGTSDTFRYDPSGAGGTVSTGNGPSANDRLAACVDAALEDTSLSVAGVALELLEGAKCVLEWAFVPVQPVSFYTSYASAATRGSGGEYLVQFGKAPLDALNKVGSGTSQQNTLTFRGNTVTLPQPPSSLANLLRGALSLFLILGVVYRVQGWIARALKIQPLRGSSDAD